jgi:hypothetical protein
MKTMNKAIAIAAITAVAAIGAVAATQGTAAAKDQQFFCDMKGQWKSDATGNADDFIFLAEYLAKDGPDYFAGKYVNPGQAEADIVGRANNATWEILFSYTDAGHKGMMKKAIGTGRRDGAKNEITVEGTYKTFLGTNDIKSDGKFMLHGKCRKEK